MIIAGQRIIHARHRYCQYVWTGLWPGVSGGPAAPALVVAVHSCQVVDHSGDRPEIVPHAGSAVQEHDSWATALAGSPQPGTRD